LTVGVQKVALCWEKRETFTAGAGAGALIQLAFGVGVGGGVGVAPLVVIDALPLCN